MVTDHDISTATKPPVPNSSSSSQTSPRATGSDEISSSSTNASDPAQDAGSRTAEAQRLPKGHVPELAEPPQDLGAETNGKGGSGARPGADAVASSQKASQSLSPPTVPLLGIGSPIPSPLQGLSTSPRVHAGLQDLPSVISVIDEECCRLGQWLVSCYGFSREGGVAGGYCVGIPQEGGIVQV